MLRDNRSPLRVWKRNLSIAAIGIVAATTTGVPTIGGMASFTAQTVTSAEPRQWDNQTLQHVATMLARGSAGLVPTAGEPAGWVRAMVLLERDGLRTLRGWCARRICRWEFADERVEYVRLHLPINDWLDLERQAWVTSTQLDGTDAFRRLQYELADRYVPRVSWPVALGTGRGAAAKMCDGPVGNSDDRRVIGLRQWTSDHPEADGRGAAIAVIERTGGLDLAHPAYAHAYSLTGEQIPKVIDIIDASSSELYSGRRDRATVPLSKPFECNRLCDVEGEAIWLPFDGEYQGGKFELGGVSWRIVRHVASRAIRVDWNQNQDFRDDTPVTRYASGLSSAYVPAAIAGAPVAVVFSEHGDATGGRVGIPALDLYTEANHTNMVASVAVANDPAGRAMGIAPGARLVIVRTGDAFHDAVEALILAARHRDVDVISNSIGLASSPNTAAQFASQLVDRVVSRYGKPFIIAAGNEISPLESADAPPGLAIAVGMGMARGTLKTLNGVETPGDFNVLGLSGSGPAADGSLRPDLVAPSAWTVVGSHSGGDRSCYGISDGSSAAAPAVAGVAALLISRARLQGMKLTASKLVWALRHGTRSLGETPAISQGRGVVDVSIAWQLLSSAFTPPSVRAAGTVSHVTTSTRLASGPGVYVREPHADQSPLAVVLRGGSPGAPLRGNLKWLHGSTAFSADKETVVLSGESGGTRVQMRRTAGGSPVASDILRLSDTESGLPVQDVLVTAVRPEASLAVGRPITLEGQLLDFAKQIRTFVVTDGAARLRLTLDVKDGSARFRLGRPMGLAAFWHPALFPDGPTRFITPLPPGTYDAVIPVAEPGTWAMTVMRPGLDRRGAREPAPDTARYVVRIAAEPRLQISTQPTDRAPSDCLNGMLLSRAMSTGVDPGKAMWTFDVPAKTSTLAVRIRDVANSTNEQRLRAYLFDCSSGHCFLHLQTLGSPAAAWARIDRPTPGQWRLVVLEETLRQGTNTAADVFVDGEMNLAARASQKTATSAAAACPGEIGK